MKSCFNGFWVGVVKNGHVLLVLLLESIEIGNELGQSLPGLHIYPNFAHSSEPESFVGR